jgi:hypothetical protein
VLQDLDAALRDVKLAISLDPKSAVARKCRYKVYRNMASEAEEDESETDELDLNGASSDDERGHRPSMKRLLMKGAFEALAGVLSSSLPMTWADQSSVCVRGVFQLDSSW